MYFILLVIFPIYIKADSFSDASNKISSYLDKNDYKNSYNKYLYVTQTNRFSGMISKKEFDITRYDKNKNYRNINYSYLWIGRAYWSETVEDGKNIPIRKDYLPFTNGDETDNIGTRVTQIINNKTSVSGSGTYGDPWLFSPQFKVRIYVNDTSKGYITDKIDKSIEKDFIEFNLSGGSRPEYIYIKPIGSNKYIGSSCGYIINSIDANKDISTGNGPYLLLSNVTRDIECNINFGEKPSTILLNQNYTECGKSNPERLYFTKSLGWYLDEYGSVSINSLNQIPCRIGYTFDGYSNSSSITAACSSTKIIDKSGKLDGSKDTLDLLNNNQTLYPCYLPNKYIVSYDVNGGNAITNNSKEVIFDSNYGTLPTPTRTGYIFSGWFTEKEYGTLIKSDTIVSNPSNHTIYAHWTPITYKIEYVTNGGTLGTKAPTSGLKYDSVIEISLPTRVGYDFAGWTASGNLNASTAKFGSSAANVSTAISSTSMKITNKYLLNLTSTDNGLVTLTATWTPRNDTKYVVKHWKQKLNAATEKNSTNYELADTNNLEGTTMSTAASTVNTYTGFVSPSKQSPSIKADGSTVINYYYDRSEYTVTLSANNSSYGSLSSGSVKLDYGNTYSVNGTKITFTNGSSSTASVTGATGYTTNFLNWSSSSGTVTNNTTITANFERIAHIYEVQYFCNSGDGSTPNSNHTYGISSPLSKNGCTKSNHTFIGWNTKSDGSGSSYSDQESVINLTSTKNGSVILYAKWRLNYYCDSGTLTNDPSKGHICVIDRSSRNYEYKCGSYKCGSYKCGTYECGSYVCDTYSCTVSCNCGWYVSTEGDRQYVCGKCPGTCNKYCTKYCDSYCNSYCDSYCDATEYYCPSGWSEYSGSGSSLKCYKAANN